MLCNADKRPGAKFIFTSDKSLKRIFFLKKVPISYPISTNQRNEKKKGRRNKRKRKDEKDMVKKRRAKTNGDANLEFNVFASRGD